MIDEVINELARASKLFNENILLFQTASQTYKSILDKDLRKRFCVGDHCRTIFMIEVMISDEWGATAKSFHTEEEAQKELARLEYEYPDMFKFRIVSRKEKD